MNKKPIDSTILERSLTLLGALLSKSSSPEISLIVCGGSSLVANRLVSRTTKDVDIIAFLDENKQIIKAEPFPEFLKRAADVVQIELQLPDNWLNNGPWLLINFNLSNSGLPQGFLDRLKYKKYSSSLNVYFIDRIDQIHFKLYAAADKGGPSYHLDDLISLSPDNDEIYEAVLWTFIQNPSPEFREIMITMLEAIGYGNIAKRI